jgi:toxin YoeB
MWEIVFTKQAIKDLKKADAAGFGAKIDSLIALITVNPYQNPPPYEKLVGDLSGYYSRRINIQHRLVYQVFEVEKKVKVIRLWSHYE